MRPVTISTYTNKKGDPRVALQIGRDFAMEIAQGTQIGYENLDLIRQVITERIEREELRRIERDEMHGA